jgi:uncharacterized protein
MFRNPIFSQTRAGFQLALFMAIILFGAIFSMLSAIILSMLFFGMGLDEIGTTMQSGSELGLQSGRLIQLISQVGMFILPPVAFALMVSPSIADYMGLKNKSTLSHYIPMLMLMFVCLPLIHGLAELNQSVSLPEGMSGLEQWMMQKEQQAREMTEFFLGVTTLGGLLFNLFMIAVMPSLGEELVFRAVLQPLLGRIFRNIHAGVLVSALIFSLMHFQFYGLIPRFVLGLFLGYAYLWTRSIWVPVLMHFVNNAAAIIVYFLWHNGHIAVDMDKFGGGGGWFAFALSAVFCLALLFYVYQNRMRAEQMHVISGPAKGLD